MHVWNSWISGVIRYELDEVKTLLEIRLIFLQLSTASNSSRALRMYLQFWYSVFLPYSFDVQCEFPHNLTLLYFYLKELNLSHSISSLQHIKESLLITVRGFPQTPLKLEELIKFI